MSKNLLSLLAALALGALASFALSKSSLHCDAGACKTNSSCSPCEVNAKATPNEPSPQ